MKRLLIVIMFTMLSLNYVNAQYVIPNFVDSPSSSNSTQSPQGTKMPNIDVVFYQYGNWTYAFYPNGSFSRHLFKTNSYDKIISDDGRQNGTYYILLEDNGIKRVYLNYSNGRTETGVLRYYNNYIEFSINHKVHRDNWY